MQATQRQRYFLLSWLTTMLLCWRLLPDNAFHDAFTGVYSLLIVSSYAALFLLPAWLSSFLCDRIVGKGRLVAVLAIAMVSLAHILLFADANIYSLYGFHINGFVVNLLLTPGGIDSLGGDWITHLSFAFLIMLLVAWQIVLWRWSNGGRGLLWLRRKPVYLLVAALISIHLGERVMNGLADIQARGEALGVADSIPLHQETTFRSLGKKLGWNVAQEQKVKLSGSGGRLRYPLQDLQINPPEKPLNLLWLVSESLRADMLDPEIMPATWQYAEKGVRFTNHFSGGNGTRMGMFSLFTGLPGSYWFSFLNEERGAAVIDTLIAQNYDMQLFTAQSFTYPEFDRTLFTRVPRERMHVDDQGEGYERDRRNIARLIDAMEHRDPAKPFFLFDFFESPHARYYFPPEAVIRPNYLKEFNYARMDVEAFRRDNEAIKARYINAVHALDMNLAPLWDYLEQKGLRENTIVIFTGDHGEEFMDNGRWGHNSEFVNAQIRPPLVMWLPGQTPRVDNRLSAHMDVTATLLPLLGVQNPASDYSLGYDLMQAPARRYTILSDWDRVAYIDPDIKITVPMSAKGFMRQRVTTFDDQPIADPASALAQKQAALGTVMKDIGRFYGKQ